MSHDHGPGRRIQLRRDTAANWALDNPVLAVGETGWVTDTRRVKLGDGVTAWNDLPFAADEAASVVAETAARIAADNAEALLRAAEDLILQVDIDTHEARTDNPHSVTKAQVGLGNVDNTTDAGKPVSVAQAAADALVQGAVDDIVDGTTDINGRDVADDGANLDYIRFTYAPANDAAVAGKKNIADVWRHDWSLIGTPNSMSAGTWTFGGWYGFSTAGSSSAAYNSVWFLDIEPGTWSFDVQYVRTNNSGIITYEYSFDNTNWSTIVANVDHYVAAGSVGAGVAGVTGVVIADQRRIYIRVRSAGTKNASSAAYYALVCAVHARRTA